MTNEFYTTITFLLTVVFPNDYFQNRRHTNRSTRRWVRFLQLE